MAEGDIGTVIDSLEFDEVNGLFPRIVCVAGDVYVVAYAGTSSHLLIATINIDSAGEIGAAVIDSFDRLGFWTSLLGLIKVADNIFAITYSGSAVTGDLITIGISDAGEIGAAVIDSLVFGTATVLDSDIVWMGGVLYAIAFRGPGDDGFLKTVTISVAGTISDTVIDSLEFDTTYCKSPSPIKVADEMIAIAYASPGDLGTLITVVIESDGSIGGAVTDSFLFEDTTCAYPKIINISGTIYAIVYTGVANHGQVKTISISAAGDIGAAVIDSFEFDGAVGWQPTIVHVSGDVYAIAYSGDGNDGFLKTVNINAAGEISDTVISTFEFDDVNCLDPWILYIGGNIYAISFTGPDDDGWLKTISIETILAGGPHHEMCMGIGP